MSGRLVSIVFDSALPAWLKPYAAVFASFADDDGKKIYPSVARVARMVGKSERSAQRALHALRGRGVLVLEVGPGHHRAPRYAFRAVALPHVGDPDQLSLFSTATRTTSRRKSVDPDYFSTGCTGTNTTPVSFMGDTGVTRSVSDPSLSTHQFARAERAAGKCPKARTA